MGQRPDKSSAAKIDFNVAALLDSHLRDSSRRKVKGLTIDKSDARILDDGFFIARKDEGWVVDVSIADVPAMVPEKHDLEYAARKMRYERNARERLFPYGFLLNYVSLAHCEKRPAMTFQIHLDKDLKITSYGVDRTVFESLKQCNDGDITEQLKQKNADVEMWVDLGQRLYAKRMSHIGKTCDKIVANDNVALPSDPAVHDHPGQEGGALVHEMMRLANQVATRFFVDHKLEAPFKNASGVVNIIRVTNDFDFDLECNAVAQKTLAELVKDIPAYTHISSPMREYKDFLGLKIIAAQLAGKTPDEGDQKYAKKLSDEFNESAARVKTDILSPQWMESWSQYRSTQNRNTHEKLERNPSTEIGSLRQHCRAQGWKMPQMAERRLLVDGAQVTLIALRCKEAGTPTSWAVHHDPGAALNLAAARQTLALSTVKNDPALKIG
jgi:hypothetical protein